MAQVYLNFTTLHERKGGGGEHSQKTDKNGEAIFAFYAHFWARVEAFTSSPHS